MRREDVSRYVIWRRAFQNVRMESARADQHSEAMRGLNGSLWPYGWPAWTLYQERRNKVSKGQPGKHRTCLPTAIGR